MRQLLKFWFYARIIRLVIYILLDVALILDKEEILYSVSQGNVEV